MKKKKTQTIELAQTANTNRVIFRVLLSSLFMLSVIYVYLIGSITFNIIAYKSLENTSKSLNNEISQLEITYLEKTNKIDKDYAMSLGFVESNHNIFATRQESRVAVR